MLAFNVIIYVVVFKAAILLIIFLFSPFSLLPAPPAPTYFLPGPSFF